MNETLYIPSSDRNYKPLNLNTGHDLKRFIELAGVAKGLAENGKPYGLGQVGVIILSDIFPQCDDGKYFEWIRAAAKSQNRNVTGWVRENFPERVPVKSEHLPSLPRIEDVAEMFHWMVKFKSTTFFFNAVKYIRGGGQQDLSWSVGVSAMVDQLREFYSSQNGEYRFYNPLKN